MNLNFKKQNKLQNKVKLENLIESFKSQIENITLTLTEFTIKNVSDCESRIKNE